MAPRPAPGKRREPPPAPERPPAAPPREIELKLRLSPADLAALRARLDALGPARPAATVDNVYYDTPDLRLAAARAALRLRCIRRGGRRTWLQTFKTEDHGAALAVRGEWETPAPGGRLDLRRLAAAPLGALLGPAAAALAPLFRTVFERVTWAIEWRGARIEAALDQGCIEAAGRTEAILELELELHAGAPAVLFDLALHLAGAGPAAPDPGAMQRSRGAGKSRGGTAAELCLLPYGASKAARGIRLALGQDALVPVPGLLKRRAARPGGPAQVPAAAPAPDAPNTVLHPGLPLGAAARRWFALALDPFLANALGATLVDDPEFVHQARIALRLMRVGAELLGRSAVVDFPPAALRQLQAWARRFGAVREWDVLCADVLPALRQASGKGGAAPWERVERAAAQRRARARLRLQERLRRPDFAAFALHWLRWCASAAPAGDRPLGNYAGKALRQQRRRLAKAARGFAGASMERQHKIRLQAKSLRYAFEMLRGVAPDALSDAELRNLSRFQDAAGRARDLALSRAALQRLTRSRSLRRQIAAWTRAQRRTGLDKARRLAVVLGVA